MHVTTLAEIGFWLAVVAGTIAAYELVRWFLLRSLARRLERTIRSFMREGSLSLDKYKFMNKFVVVEELLDDRAIHEAVLDYSEAHDLGIEETRERVEEYLEEIVPAFNLLAYYQVGARVAKALMNALYQVVVDRRNIDEVQGLPKGSVVIFVANHRSNVDYVLVAHLLARHIALSYAVGEWARIWPLENLFKSFGSYFVRRGFRDELYHTVLRRYVQHSSQQGVTQGIFLEGGLTRDGRLRDPKIGLLDYLIQLKCDPGFEADIVFVPVGINFDWVLEDRTLLDEHEGKKAAPGLGRKLLSLGTVLVVGPFTLVVNAIRRSRGRVRRHGYASARIGRPVSLDAYLRESAPDLAALDRSERLPEIAKLAAHLMEGIACSIPVTPVPLVASALLELARSEPGGPVAIRALRTRVLEHKQALAARGVTVVMGQEEFSAEITSRERLEEERADRRPGLVDFEDGWLHAQEAEILVGVALDLLDFRRLVSRTETEVRILPGGERILRYYARSIEPHGVGAVDRAR